VLYKLLQLQQYDRDILLRLSTRFSEYDSGDNGRVVIGLDVPSAEQVNQMKHQLKASMNEQEQEQEQNGHQQKKGSDVESGSTPPPPQPPPPPPPKSSTSKRLDDKLLIPMWDDMKKQILAKKRHRESMLQKDQSEWDEETRQAHADQTTSTNGHPIGHDDEDHVKLKDLDFTWSKRLWLKAAKETGFIALTLLVVYLLIGYFVFIYDSEQMNEVQGWYFIAATLSTVVLLFTFCMRDHVIFHTHIYIYDI
jgi:hypothetical protein